MKQNGPKEFLYKDDGITCIWGSPFKRYYSRKFYRNPVAANMPAELLLRLDCIGEEHTVKGYWRRRVHAELFSIEFVIDGTMRFEQDKKTYQVEAGNVFFVHQGRNNEFYSGKYCHKLAVSISGGCLGRVLNRSGLSEVDVLKLDNPTGFEKLIRNGIREIEEKKTGYRRRTSLICSEILYLLTENLHHSSYPAKLREAIELMECQMASPLTLDDICGVLGTSASSLGRLFREHLSKTPIEYLISMRMEEAKSLLSDFEYSIKEIAQRMGYSNQLYFSAEFKKRFGVSPRKYRFDKDIPKGN
jgi:AraC-like DNA-binding protein